MTDARRKVLRLMAGVIATISAVIQILIEIYAWWTFDPRLSCDRLPYWEEWIDCLHGQSHLYVMVAELAVGSWLIAGVAIPLARFLPPYISVMVPGGLAVAFIWLVTRYWHEEVAPYGEPTLSYLFEATIVTGLTGVFLVGPVAAGWLLGLYARTGRRTLRVSAAIFE